jgi:hypothetical protein
MELSRGAHARLARLAFSFSGFQPGIQLVWCVGVSTGHRAFRDTQQPSSPCGSEPRQVTLLAIDTARLRAPNIRRIACASHVQQLSILLGMELWTPVCLLERDDLVKTEFVPCE